MFRKALLLVTLRLGASSAIDCADEEDCLASSQDAGASWMQMKIGKVANAKTSEAEVSSEGYYWVKRGGSSRGGNTASWPVPMDLSHPVWMWENELDEQIRHSPLIDDKKNIYVAGTLRLRKFSPDGKLLWLFHQEEKGNTSPTIANGTIFWRVGQGTGHIKVFALDMETGRVKFESKFAGNYSADSGSLLAVDGQVVIPATVNLASPASDSLISIDASTGDKLWEYTTDEVMWNFSPNSAGDGTIVFSSTCGSFFRIATNGTLVYKKGPSYGMVACSTGGGTAGPDGRFYAVHGNPKPGYTQAKEGDPFLGFSPCTNHAITAYDIATGEQVWEYPLEEPHESSQYPAVGRLYEGGPMAVVAAVGQNGGLPVLMDDAKLAKYLSDPEYRKSLNVTVFKNSVIALNAETGKQIWLWNESDWDHFGSAGDEEPLARRLTETVSGGQEGPFCLPDNMGIPLINTKEGTVYLSSAHTGDMTRMKDTNRNGVIEPEEVSVFQPGIAFLNSPAAAPDMLVAAPCWGPMYVFKN